MNGADWIILAVLGMSGLFSLMRGFVREAISLAAWVAAFLVAITMSPNLAVLLQPHISTETLRIALAFMLLFFFVLLVGSLASKLLVSLLKLSGLSGIDRLLGMVFGVMRGGIVVLACLIIFPALLGLNELEWWHESRLIPQFLMLEDWAIATFSDISKWRSEIISG